MKTYLAKCSKCKKETPHEILLLSRKKGVKLICGFCMTSKKRYYKNQSLKECEVKND